MYTIQSSDNEITSEYALNKMDDSFLLSENYKKTNNVNSLDSIHFKILVPSITAGAVIGKKGEAIAKIQKETGAKVKMSKSNDFYPGTMERVCLIVGSMESILQVFEYIVDRMLDKSDTSHASIELSNSAMSVKEDSISLVSTATYFGRLSSMESNSMRFPMDRQKQVKILVPNSTAGLIIGKGGQFIREIKEMSGAYVQISQKPNDSTLSLPERCVIIAGERENNRFAVRMILQKIAEDPQSATCPQISYSDCIGPLPSAYPTGSPFAVVSGAAINGGNGTISSNMLTATTVNGTSAALNGGGSTYGLWSKSRGAEGTLPNNWTLDGTKKVSLTLETRLRARRSLLAAGYSEKAADDILNAMQVLSQHGLLNHHMLFSDGNSEFSMRNACKLNLTNPLENLFNINLPQGPLSHTQSNLRSANSIECVYPPTYSDGSSLNVISSTDFLNSPPYPSGAFGAGFMLPPFSPPLSGQSQLTPQQSLSNGNSLSLMKPLMLYNNGGLNGMQASSLSSLFSPNCSYNFSTNVDSTSLSALNGVLQQRNASQAQQICAVNGAMDTSMTLSETSHTRMGPMENCSALSKAPFSPFSSFRTSSVSLVPTSFGSSQTQFVPSVNETPDNIAYAYLTNNSLDQSANFSNGNYLFSNMLNGFPISNPRVDPSMTSSDLDASNSIPSTSIQMSMLPK